MLPRLWMSGPFLTVRRRRTVPPVNLLMEFDLSVTKRPFDRIGDLGRIRGPGGDESWDVH